MIPAGTLKNGDTLVVRFTVTLDLDEGTRTVSEPTYEIIEENAS